ncbi:hypothetical protein ACQR50_02045 [Sphingomonas sp. Xoc002]|uniref:hypothetical protein n=1 Tax=Sphingomonas sp. Xoc002 TaxID=2837624 RepID=UPI003D17BA5B
MRYHFVSTPLQADRTALHRVGLSIKTVPVPLPAGKIPPRERPYRISRDRPGTMPDGEIAADARVMGEILDTTAGPLSGWHDHSPGVGLRVGVSHHHPHIPGGS